MSKEHQILRSVLLAVFLIFSIGIFAQNISPKEEDTYQKKILKYINQYRVSKGKSRLQLEEHLNSIALQHSENMSESKVAFGHDGFGERMAAAKVSFPKMTGFAENVAYGMQSPKEVTDDWIGSAGHRRNILGDYRLMGISVARGGDGYLYFTQVFLR